METTGNTATASDITTMQNIMDRLDVHSTATSQCCPACGQRLEKRISTYDTSICYNLNCRQITKGYDLTHQALPEFYPLEDDENVARALTYYHWTAREDWYDQLPEDLMAHLDCKQAAWERMKDERYDRRWLSEKDNPEGYVYSVKLIPGATILAEVLRDDQDSDGEELGTYSEFYNGYIERYLNVMEAPGSISICAGKELFYVVKVESAREAFGNEAVEMATPQK